LALHQYLYQACDVEGNILTGRLSAENQQEAVLNLQNQQLIPLKIEQEPETRSLMERQTVSSRDIIDFTEGLCTLVEAKIPIDRALTLLQNTTVKPAVQQLIEDLRQEVKEGKSLAEALQTRPTLFSRMYINMVHAGEEGGILDQLLPKVAYSLAMTDQAKRTIISSLIYPAILLFTGLISVILLMIFVVPSFAQLFKDMGTHIPTSAAFLLGLSDWLTQYGWTLLLIPVGLMLLWKQLNATTERRTRRDHFLLSLPILGQLILQSESSRFCRTLGALLSAGIPLLKSLHIVRGVMENEVLANSLDQVEDQVRGGTSLGRALSNQGQFPVLLTQLIIVGEESGRTAQILEKLAEKFDNTVKQYTARLVALLEPLLILALGAIVGTIVIIMLSAIFSINEVNF